MSAGTFFEQLGTTWREWSAARRLSVVVGALLSLGAFATLISMGARPDYTPLMTGLDPVDAAEIADVLREKKIPFEIQAGGSALLVPRENVHSLRLDLAAEGLPKGGGVGFEIFNEPAFGMSRFAEKLNYRRALEGELARTLREIATVKDARVHIVLPERSLFRKEARRARASATLHMLPGRRLNESQVQAVVHLLSSSVSELHPDDVTVVDGSGTILAKGGGDGAGLMTNAALSYQQDVESRLEQRVTEILERAVGRSSASVRVSAEVDMTQVEKTKEEYDPDNFVLRSERTSEEQSTSTAGNAAGVPGARTNLAGGAVQGGRGAGSTRRSNARNYEINKIISKERTALGRVTRLSVAVLVDGRRQLNEDGGVEVVERDAQELARLEGLVKKAIGYNEERGDQVELQSMVFSRPAEEEFQAPPEWLSYVRVLWRPVLGLLLLLVVARFLLKKRKKVTPAQRPQELISRPTSVREIEAAMTQDLKLTSGERAQDLPELQDINPEPAEAAQVLRGWMAEK